MFKHEKRRRSSGKNLTAGTWNHNGGLENDLPFQRDDFQVPAVSSFGGKNATKSLRLLKFGHTATVATNPIRT